LSGSVFVVQLTPPSMLIATTPNLRGFGGAVVPVVAANTSRSLSGANAMLHWTADLKTSVHVAPPSDVR
jgi:hypothetical protein